MVKSIHVTEIISRIRLQFLARGVIGARDLGKALNVSQPTISRALGTMGPAIVRIGRGPSTRYGLAAPIGDLGHAWPLYLIDPRGAPREIGVLHSLAGPAWWLEMAPGTAWQSLTATDFPDAIFPGLPWFLDDLRPQGFLGRSFARRHAARLGVDSDPTNWSERAVAESLLKFGGDLPGAFVVGAESLAAALQSTEESIPADLRPEVYPRLATEALAGGLPRSSAGGEQPKFTAIVAKSDGPESVIVKFSPPLETPEGRRWADLLAAEAIAAEILRTAGFATAPTEWIDAGGRRFLEVARFDRTRNGGRIPFVSLLAHDAAFFGEMNTPWNDAAERLRSKGWLEAMDADRLDALWRFGRLIANTDMHYGNAALLLNDRPPLRLAPLYDMLPMAYRPGLENTIPALSEEMLARAQSAASPERNLALSFWQAVAESRHVSDSFRSIAQGHEKALRQRP